MGRGVLHGLLITYRRPTELAGTLARLAEQTRRPDRLVVVDNDPTSRSRELVRDRVPDDLPTEYVAAPENLGPAGGIALGMRVINRSAADRDWIVLVDDDNPPATRSLLEELESFAEAMSRRDARTGAVGLVGARFDCRRGRLRRVPDGELHEAVPVDYVGGGQYPLYRVAAVRAVGDFRENLFFGFDDLEYGLRMGAAGYSIYADGPLWMRERERARRLGMTVRPSIGLEDPSWRRYYSLRNLIVILRASGHVGAAVRVTLTSGLAKPAVNLPRRPGVAARSLAFNARACLDGWTGRMGRTVEPVQRG
jgi:rhamnopyranosyl-N-acetylglucosaminyl-diphospho-decaprenol beta-1,3/1,4-galactofuranosyltransferase